MLHLTGFAFRNCARIEDKMSVADDAMSYGDLRLLDIAKVVTIKEATKKNAQPARDTIK